MPAEGASAARNAGLGFARAAWPGCDAFAILDEGDRLGPQTLRRGFQALAAAPEVAAVGDFVGSTGAMMKYVKTTPAPYFLMLTECGLVGRLEVESPEKHFIGGCRLCPYMKLNSLEKIRDALRAPRPDQIVTLDEGLRLRAAKCIDRMFELTPGD
jgi:hypothetical protein